MKDNTSVFSPWQTRLSRSCVAIVMVLALLSHVAGSSAARQEQPARDDRPAATDARGLAQPASWQPATYSSARDTIMAWAESPQTDDLQRLKIEAIWPATDSSTNGSQPLLDRLTMTLPILAPETASVLERIQQPRRSSALPRELQQATWSERPRIEPTMRLLVGRWLCENEFYDEALEQLSQLNIDQSLDPASLLYYRGIASQRLLDKDKTIADFEKLLENEGVIPHRYERIAKLVLADIKPLQQDTLEEIAKLMEDVRRRQSLHRSGARVLEQEQQVVDKLTKLIEELEQQQQDQQEGGQNQDGSAKPSRAMESSRTAGGKGEGNVDRKSQSPGRAWGNLDPEDRAAALAELAKDLPAHYREVIEDYFRKLAEDDKINPR